MMALTADVQTSAKALGEAAKEGQRNERMNGVERVRMEWMGMGEWGKGKGATLQEEDVMSGWKQLKSLPL